MTRVTSGVLAAVTIIPFLLLGACTDNTIVEEPIVLGNSTAYAELVQPYVGLRCSSLDCHGDSGRPLRIFAEDGLRLRDDLREQPIAPEEIMRNVESFAGASPDSSSPEQHLALLKGLATDAGGFAHEGGDIWLIPDEPGYQCIRAWLAGSTDVQTARDACMAAFIDVAGTEQ